MDELLNMLGGRGGGSVQQLAKQFGISDEQAEGAIRGLAPALTSALGKNTASPDGLQALLGAVQSGGHDRYIEDPASLADPATTEDGNKILGHLLGSKDESRRVAAAAAPGAGLDVGMLKQMLPLVASLLMGSLGSGAKKEPSGGSGIDMGGLASVLQGLGAGGGGGALGEVLGGALGGGSTSSGRSGGGSGGLGGLLGRFLGRR